MRKSLFPENVLDGHFEMKKVQSKKYFLISLSFSLGLKEHTDIPHFKEAMLLKNCSYEVEK